MLPVCYRYARDREEAEDMLQEGFLKVFRNLSRYQEQGNLGAWIRRVVVNACIDVIRREKHYRQQVEVPESVPDTFGADAVSQIEAGYLLDLIQQLPDGYRVVFNLYAIEGFSHAEIGERLSISESTSRSQYYRARTLLQEKIRHAYQAPKPLQDAI